MRVPLPPCDSVICVGFSDVYPGIGGLVGVNWGDITSSYATGAVDGYPAGGLTGYNGDTIVSSYATGPVTGTTVGGLVGRNGRDSGKIYASYATGSVSGGLEVGGLVGTNVGLIQSSYATGGELAGGGHSYYTTASYWDSTTSGISEGSTTAQLQVPTGYSGIYGEWNLDLDHDGTPDYPWNFGTTAQYPALSADFDGDGRATWQEFGHQLRAGPTLTVTSAVDQAVLTWTAVDSGHWTPPPGITYTVYRHNGATVENLVENLEVREYTDSDVADGPYIYQVAAVVDGGQATHSARVDASTRSNNAPDLVVDAPTVSDSSPLAGASLTLSATVRNQGDGAASVTTLAYYRSSDATITTGDTSVGTDPVSRLGAGNTSAESIPLTAPSSAGIYYYGACVGSLWNESDTTNNCSTAVRVTVVGPPDLVVGTPTVSDSSPLAGASLTLSATVRNQGGSAAGSTTLTYYRSSDATISTSDTSVGTDAVSGLGAGNTSPESTGLTAPATAGTYYYGACVGAVANESDTTNNCSTAVRVTVIGPPDLVVDAPTVSDSSPLAGASLTLSATVRNQGGSAAGSTTLRYYRSSDATITTADSQVGTDAVNGLGAGNTSPESTGLTAPATVGTYYYGACVGSVGNESDTTNNCSTAVRVTVVGPPDLVVGTPTVSDSSPLAGASFTLSAAVRNSGGSAGGSTTLRYYRSSDATITTGDSQVGTDAVSGLGAGNTSPESTGLTAPATAGMYYYGACVGPVANESDTTNNCSTAVRVTVVGPPDLVVGTPTVSDSSPLAGSATLRYYRSSDATITTGDSQVGTDAVSGLGAGNTSAESTGLTAPATTGTYYYGACVGSVANESDTTNNCSTAVRVTVVAPDVVVDAPTVSNSNPTAGASFTLIATVRNRGDGAAGSSTLRYYRSGDATITTGDTAVGTDPVSGLGAGNTSPESIGLTAPATTGTYYYGACVGVVANESDTTNNCSAAVRVTVVGPPDLVVGTPTVSDSSPLAGASFTLAPQCATRAAARRAAPP